MKPYVVEHHSSALVYEFYLTTFKTLKEARKFARKIISYNEDDTIFIYKRLYKYKTNGKKKLFKRAVTFK